MKTWVLLFALLCNPLFSQINEVPKLGLLNISTGSWIAYEGSIASLAKRSEFNKIPSLDAYFSWAGLNGYVGMPVAFNRNFEKCPDESFRIGVPQVQFYLGRRFGFVEPRLGASLYTGYNWKNSCPWMGTGTTDLTIGLGMNALRNQLFEGTRFSAETEFQFVIFEAQALRGTVSNSTYLKGSYALSENFNSGMELMLLSSYTDWNSWKDERKLLFMPQIFMDYNITPKTSLGFKVGRSLYAYGEEKRDGEWNKKDSNDSFNISFLISLYR